VKISKKGDKVILEPFKESAWPEDFWDGFPLDPGFDTPDPLMSKAVILD